MYFEQNISGPIFIADAPDVVIGSANSGNVRATITVNGDSWDIELSPSLQDGEYKARLRLKDVLDSIVGSPDFLDATASTIAPKVSIKADNGMEEAVSMEFQALYGNAEGKTPADMKRHWLTWREQISATTRSAREFLTFVSGLKLLGWKAGTFSAMARLFIHGSEPIDIPISEGQLESDCKYYKICYSPSKLCEAASVDISKLMAIDCWFSLSGTDSGGSSASVTSFPLRMIVSGANDLRMKEFIFRNSLGIEDRVISFGVNTRNVDGESRVFTSDGLSHELDNSSIESFQVQSGNISSARGAALWSDFLKASGRYMVSGEKATEIVVEEWDTDITEGALGSVSFKYHLSKTGNGRWFDDSESLGDYNPLEKYGALSVAGPEVATPPTEDLFFLKTRLDEFPLVELGEDFLLLVQSGASYSWGSASLKSLRDWLAKNVSAEALHLWCGPWEDYSEAVSKYALSAGAGKELLDIINKMDIASLMGSTAIGGTRSYLYWNGSAWATKALGDNAFTNISKVSQLTNDSGYITGITKAMVEAVLTGDVTSHTHSQYLTAHQTIYALTIQKNGTTVGTYTPNSQAATINIIDVASAATLSGHITNTTVHITANERTLWNKIAGLFDVDADGDVYVKNGKGFYTEGFISAGAKGTSGGSGSTYTQKEWLQIKEMTESASGILASAYAVKEAYNELNTAIETLAGKATNVTFSQTLTSGKQIGSISIDGKSTSLFAPANYAWSEVTGKPAFATVATSGSYADLSNKPTIASLMGSAAIGGTSSFIYWNGSAFASKALGTNAFTSISKVSQLTNDSGYISGITKSMVEAVLTGDITSHTHSQYLTSHQTVSLASGTNNGTLKLTVGSTTTDNIAVKGLGSAAYTNSSAYAAASHTHSQYLTAHQPIYALTIQKNGTTAGTYTPNSQAATINISDVASAATLSSHTTNTTVHITANERTLWNKITGLFDVDTDGDVYVKNGKGFYTEGFISAGAKGTSGGGGSTYTQKEWAQIKEMTATAAGSLASAYAVKEAYSEAKTLIDANTGNITSLTSRVTSLEGKATAVSFLQTLTSGTKIGAITVDGTTTNIYAPSLAALMGTTAIGGESAYPYWNGSAWATKSLGSNAFTSISKVSQLTNDSGYITGITKAMVENVLTGNITSHTHSYLPLSGGTMTGAIVMGADIGIIGINELAGGMVYFSSTSKKTVIGSVGISTISATHIRSVTGHATIGTSETAMNDILDSGNYSAYASPKTHTHTLKINGSEKTIAATGGTAVDLGSYLPITGGKMSNTNVVTNLNADLLDGFDITSVVSAQYGGDTLDLNEIYNPSIYRLATSNPNLPSDNYNYANILTVKVPTYDTAWQLLGAYSSDRLLFRRGTWYADGRGTLRTNAWRQIAFIDSNVASSSKWATPRTITLTGSVTGSVSIDGSGDVSLATTTNHTHSYLPLSGGTISSSVTTLVTLNSTGSESGIRFQLKNVPKGWAGYNATYGTHLFTYADSAGDGANHTLGIRCNGNGYIDSNTILHSGNYNTYAPTLTGTGASGTWGISISGNAATATNADTLDGVHFRNILERETSGYARGTDVGWYRIAETYQNNSDSYCFLLGIQRSYGYTNNETYLFSICISYNGRISITQLSGYANTRLITKIRVDWGSNAYYIDLYINTATDGNTYRWYTVGAAKSYNAWTANPTLNGTAYEFTTVNGCKSDLGFTGNIAGNATSATKLANSRTIWGQSFDGTGNVHGGMGGVTFIEMSYLTPFIDFHYNYSTADFTSRIIEGLSGQLTVIGKLRIGLNYTTSTDYNLHVVGTAYASEGLVSDGYISAAATSTSSDIRLKDNISEIGSKTALQWLLMLKPKSWTWNDEAGVKGQSMGFVAQDVESILPQMVKKQDNGYLSLDYTQLHALEVAGLQDHEKRIEELERENKILKEELNKLKLNAN